MAMRFSSFACRRVTYHDVATKSLFQRTRIASFSATPTMSSDTGPSVVLYQYAICPFCNITKAALSFASVNYEAVEVNPLTKAEIKWSKDYKKVPIATMDGEQLNGSDVIVRKILERPHVATRLNKKLQKMSTETFMDSDGAKKWVGFARDDLASLLYPNICRTWNDSYLAFSYVKDVEHFSSLQKFAIQNVGSLAMYFAASKIKKKRNISDERQALSELLVHLEKEGFGEGKPFLSGTDEPDLGDVAVYGTLRAIEGLPAHTQVVEERDASSPIPDWYKRMKDHVER